MIPPTPDDAAAIVLATLGEQAQTVTRFATGLAHYVYEVTTTRGAVVVRMAAEDPLTLVGAVYWSERLRPRGAPLPAILHADVRVDARPFPYLLLERLPGTDLGHVYDGLTTQQKRTVACEVVRAQQIAASLPSGHGFGYVAGYEQPFPQRTWREVVDSSLQRSRERITAAGVFDPVYVERVADWLAPWQRYFESISPAPFLHDTTTKNVLIDQGRFQGIVDVDDLCFGDPLWAVGLTRMALLSGRHDLDYIGFWCEAAQFSAEQRAVLPLYSAVFCVDFMSELGQRFNQSQPLPADPARICHLQAVFEACEREIVHNP